MPRQFGIDADWGYQQYFRQGQVLRVAKVEPLRDFITFEVVSDPRDDFIERNAVRFMQEGCSDPQKALHQAERLWDAKTSSEKVL